MKISTKGRYGLKAMIYIANDSSNSPVSLRSISDSEGISENYLEQIIAPLKREKFLKSIRGANGGYILAKDASEISVGDILRTLEGSLAPVDCIDNEVEKEHTCGSKCSNNCATKGVWQKIYDSVLYTVDSISLQSLVEDGNII